MRITKITFKEYLAEADTKKYTFGTWKKTIGNIISDFMGKEHESLMKMFQSLQASDLKNIARNATGYINQEKDENIKSFLKGVVSSAEEVYSKNGSKKEKPTVTATDWAEFEKLLKSFDKHYQKSEDPKVIAAGEKASTLIQMLYKKLVQVDKERADKLMKE